MSDTAERALIHQFVDRRVDGVILRPGCESFERSYFAPGFEHEFNDSGVLGVSAVVAYQRYSAANLGLFAAILFPVVRSTVIWLLIIAGCWLLILVIIGIVLLMKFSRAVGGPKSLSGTRCPKCRKRSAMQETSRQFLHGNVKFNFDHYRVVYHCSACGHEQEQEELVDLKK